MQFLHPFLLFISIGFCCTVQSFRLQGVGVKGQLLCKGSYSVHTSVAIFDVDRNPGDPDDLLDETFTDRNGRFVVDGSTRELTNIEPELRIIHDCDDGIKPCHRLLTIKVPGEYIHHGKVEKFFDIGQLDLEQKGENEARTCHLDFHGNRI